MTREYGERVFIQGCGSEGTADLRKMRIHDGCEIFPGCLPAEQQTSLLGDLRRIMAEAPLYRPHMPRTGRPFSVMMTNCGPLGWVSDQARGYRYERLHPQTCKPWPPIPDALLELWNALTDFPHPPEACLINYYAPGARMGMHRDEDEADLSAPILSVSLGDSAIFKVGGLKRGGTAAQVKLESGDALVMAGPSRMRYHGVSRILAGTSMLLAEGGRINLTLRHVGS